MGTAVVVGILAVAVAAALCSLIRGKSSPKGACHFGCAGDCSSCGVSRRKSRTMKNGNAAKKSMHRENGNAEKNPCAVKMGTQKSEKPCVVKNGNTAKKSMHRENGNTAKKSMHRENGNAEK